MYRFSTVITAVLKAFLMVLISLMLRHPAAE
jgi:hypothetical protein